MNSSMKTIICVAGLGVVAGCVETSGSGGGTSSGGPVSDEAACLSAVSERAASSSNAILSYETSEANNLAMIRDQFGVEWRCLVNGGSVVELNPVF